MDTKIEEKPQTCNVENIRIPTENKDGGECPVCSTLGVLRTCSRCHKSAYCSKDCQKKDWKNHRQNCTSKDGTYHSRDADPEECKPSKQTDAPTPQSSGHNNAASSKGCGDRCSVCGTRSTKTCARCKIAIYCSTICQRQHWAVHKPHCVKVDGVLKTPGSQEYDLNLQDDHESYSESPRSSLLDFLFANRNINVSARHERKVPFEKAKTRCARFFPATKIIGNFHQIPAEFMGMRPPRQREVLLAFICGQHDHVFRHGVYIRDKDDDETHVLFYLDGGRRPEPYFSWRALTPGKYICICDPFIHYFMDGTAGLRIEDPSDIKILDI
ncbi:hypothetical protein ScPMuIL_018308 [Solemya velum]